MLTENDIVELYRKASTELPHDVYERLRKAAENEKEGAKEILENILNNADAARKERKPMCQDTGVPVFYVHGEGSLSRREIADMIQKATEKATLSIPLRPNAIDSLSDEVVGNRPIIHFEESGRFRIDLLLKGGGSENVSRIYSLPDADLDAGRDILGIKKCVLDAVIKAQGKACPPYVIGVAVGGTVEEVSRLSKKQLLRKLDDKNADGELAKTEEELTEKINRLGIGPAGLGGKTTALAVKLSKSFRHPASFFVGVAFSCWALRRASYEP